MRGERLGIDPVDFRRRNLIAEREMPYPLRARRELDSRPRTDSGELSRPFAR